MTISVGNLIVAGGATVDTSEVLSALNKQGLKVWVGTTSQRDALPENVKNDDKITFLTYDSEEDIYLIVDTIISYSKTWSSVKISTELAKKINSSDVYTKTEVMSLINAKVASALKYKGAVATTAALPSSGQENGDSYYVQADGYMYAWSDDYSDWQALGSATDMTDYYTKSEVDAIAADLAVKFQYPTMPTADSTTVGKIIQYTGADTNDYKNGYWYKGTDNGDSTYSWTVYTDDKYALSIYSNDLQLTYEGSTYPTTSALITQLTSDIIARKHSSGTVGGNIAITWTGKSCITGSYSIHSSGAGFVVLDFENAQDGNKHCVYYISNGSATGITWSNLATASDVTNYLKDKMSCYTWGTDKTLRAVFYEVTDRGIMPDTTDAVGKRIIARYGNALINRITQVSGTKSFYWDNTLVLSCPFNDDTTKLTNVLEIFVGTTGWQQFATVSSPQNGWITITSVSGSTANATATYNKIGIGDLVNVKIDSGVLFIPSWWGTVTGLSSLGITHIQNVQGISGECHILARVCENVDGSIYLDFLRDSGVATKSDLGYAKFPSITANSSQAVKITRNSISSGSGRYVDVFGNVFMIGVGDQLDRFSVVKISAPNLPYDVLTFARDATAMYIYSNTYQIHFLELLGDLSYEVIAKSAIPAGAETVTIQ